MKEKKTSKQLEAMIAAELQLHDAPAGLSFAIVPDGNTWRPILEPAPGKILNQVDWIARAVQISDQLKRQYELVR